MVNELDPDLIKKIDNLPKVQCPIAHYFAPGIYLREMQIPKGTIAIGHYHKTNHFCILIQGVAIFIKENRKPEMLTGPITFLADTGHKIVFAATDIIVQNIHPNPDNITDQDKLEEVFIDKSNYFAGFYKENDHIEDINDFKSLNFRHIEYEPFIELPIGFKTVISIRQSDIHGKGVFSSYPWKKNQYIGPVKMNGKLTELGRYLNHSKNPNAFLKRINDDEIIIIAKNNINGCTGDSKGTEITIDYRELTSCLGEPSQGPPLLRSVD